MVTKYGDYPDFTSDGKTALSELDRYVTMASTR